jgi:AAA family ATP:ADP antiporter
MRLLGIGVALAVLPLVTLGCFGALRVAPILPVLAVCQVARRSLDFALTKPAREVLFTMVERAEKYKAKSFIDTFVYRGGDAFAAAGFEALPAGVIAAAMTAVCGAWAIVGLVLGRWNRRVPAPHRRAL